MSRNYADPGAETAARTAQPPATSYRPSEQETSAVSASLLPPSPITPSLLPTGKSALITLRAPLLPPPHAGPSCLKESLKYSQEPREQPRSLPSSARPPDNTSPAGGGMRGPSSGRHGLQEEPGALGRRLLAPGSATPSAGSSFPRAAAAAALARCWGWRHRRRSPTAAAALAPGPTWPPRPGTHKAQPPRRERGTGHRPVL